MYNVQYSKKAINKLKYFIKTYKFSYIKLIKWSGIYFEKEIIANYIKIWDKLYEDIINKIEEKIKVDTIFWNIINTKKYVIIKINSFKVFIYYQEKKKLKERYVNNIEFYKK